MKFWKLGGHTIFSVEKQTVQGSNINTIKNVQIALTYPVSDRAYNN